MPANHPGPTDPPAPTPAPTRPRTTALRTAARGLFARTPLRRWTSRNANERVSLVIHVYVRGTHNRIVELQLPSHAPTWWATQRALISLEDPHDADQFRLLLRQEPLHRRRSLAKNRVRNGDTLDLVHTDTIPSRSHGPARRLYSRTLARLGIRTP
jgi:hypothetical protein